MRSVSAGFVTRLLRDETNYTFLCKITKLNGDIIRLSSSNGDVVVGGNTYLGSPGFSFTSITSAAFGRPPNVDVSIPVSTTGPITPDDAVYGVMDNAAVDIYMADYIETADGLLNLFRGKVEKVEIDDGGRCSFFIEGFASDLLEIVVDTYSESCSANLGDSRCNKNLSSFTYSATIATVASRSVFTLNVTVPGGSNGWMAHGALKFTSGANDGFAYDIRKWVQSSKQVSLWVPAMRDVTPGDALSVVAGCDKRFATCKNKFDNVINFQGFPTLPRRSQMKCGKDWEDRPGDGTTYVVQC